MFSKKLVRVRKVRRKKCVKYFLEYSLISIINYKTRRVGSKCRQYGFSHVPKNGERNEIMQVRYRYGPLKAMFVRVRKWYVLLLTMVVRRRNRYGFGLKNDGA